MSAVTFLILLTHAFLMESAFVKFPTIPNQFTMVYEHVNVKQKTAFAQKEYYDYKAKLVRFDLVPEPRTELRRKYGARPLIVVWDFNTGHQYILDRLQSNCSITDIPTGEFPSADVGHGHVQMQKAFAFIRRNVQHAVKKAGKASVRGIQADVWELSSRDGTLHKIFFMDYSWEMWPNRNTAGVKQPLLAIEYLYKNTSKLYMATNIVDFTPMHPEISVYDVTACFNLFTGQLKLAFKIKGNYKENVFHKKIYIYTAVRDMIAKKARVSPIRITSLRIYQWRAQNLTVLFTLRDHPLRGNVLHPYVGPNVTQAYHNLLQGLSHRATVFVAYPGGGKTLRIVLGSLMLQDELFRTSRSSPPKSYSPGSMAGLGIGMLLLGCILGLVAAFVMYKKFNTKIPYQVTK